VIAVVVFTDGRTNVLRRTIASFEEQVSGPIIERWIYDDSGNAAVRAALVKNYPQYTLIGHPSGERQGFSGAVRTAWAALKAESMATHVFHLEDDFTFNRPVDLEDFTNILGKRPNLCQVACLRQAWNAEEIRAGGVIERQPENFVSHLDKEDRCWLEQDMFFTTNPSVYRMNLLHQFDWPEGEQSEGRFTALVKGAGYKFAYWGAPEDGPLVHHIGQHRHGEGY